MGRASDVFRELSEQPPLSDDERFGGALPPLRLKPELTVEVSGPTEVVDGLRAIKDKRVRNVLIRESSDGYQAVLVPIDRYVELLGRELQLSRDAEVRDSGGLQPQGLADAEVELTDPSADWPHLARG
jgi:hypothetical protein